MLCLIHTTHLYLYILLHHYPRFYTIMKMRNIYLRIHFYIQR